MTADDRVQDLTDQAANRAVERVDPDAGRRLTRMWVAAAVLALCVLGGGSYFAVKLADLQGQADSNAAIARTLGEQVEDLGGTPRVQPPAAPGADGADGVDGRDGEDGTDGTDGQDGRDGDPGTDGVDGVNGNPGADGADGADGTDGVDGQSPPCLAEPSQCRGADGVDGQDGQDGAPGADGQPGPTCPDGYVAEPREYDPTPLLPGDEETWWVCVATEEGT